MVRWRRFPGSAAYWERRYARGGTSGEGSYGDLARFKAGVLNDFVAEHQVQTVVELGCGDGHQLSLATYPSYVGFDVSARAVELCRQRFADEPPRRFELLDEAGPGVTAELAMSLDVIYHLVEDEVFERHLRQLFDAASRFVAIYSSDLEQSTGDAHVRHRAFSDWVQLNEPGWALLRRVANPIEDRPTTASFAFSRRV